MTDRDRDDDPVELPVEPPDETSTGHDVVDAVLASLAGLDAGPVAGHVPVFEAAHNALRQALARAGDEPGAGQG